MFRHFDLRFQYYTSFVGEGLCGGADVQLQMSPVVKTYQEIRIEIIQQLAGKIRTQAPA